MKHSVLTCINEVLTCVTMMHSEVLYCTFIDEAFQLSTHVYQQSTHLCNEKHCNEVLYACVSMSIPIKYTRMCINQVCNDEALQVLKCIDEALIFTCDIIGCIRY